MKIEEAGGGESYLLAALIGGGGLGLLYSSWRRGCRSVTPKCRRRCGYAVPAAISNAA